MNVLVFFSTAMLGAAGGAMAVLGILYGDRKAVVGGIAILALGAALFGALK